VALQCYQVTRPTSTFRCILTVSTNLMFIHINSLFGNCYSQTAASRVPSRSSAQRGFTPCLTTTLQGLTVRAYAASPAKRRLLVVEEYLCGVCGGAHDLFSATCGRRLQPCLDTKVYTRPLSSPGATHGHIDYSIK
jgi:hypothetical protein